MRIFRQVVIYILMLMVFVGTLSNGPDISGFEFITVIGYGGFFLLILDEVLFSKREILTAATLQSKPKKGWHTGTAPTEITKRILSNLCTAIGNLGPPPKPRLCF